MKMPNTTSEVNSASGQGSPLALGGLIWGVGVLDAVEVLRYMDATFRRYAEEEGKQDEQDG